MADLGGADLEEANLEGAHLSRANLLGAHLWGAVLRGAQLQGADLQQTNLERANLREADLTEANLREAKLTRAFLVDARLHRANFSGATLIETNFSGADLNGANLNLANLTRANLSEADLTGANLTRANLTAASLIRTTLSGASLSGASVYGVSAWSLDLSQVRDQANLRITPNEEPDITVDNLEVAQFVYLLLHNQKIRDVLDTIGSRGVLILGRFTPDRKAVLDAIREKLRQLGFVPMMFDFEKPTQMDFTETVKTLAGLSRFVIADITNPRSSPLELQATMPDYMIPFVPIIQMREKPFTMFRDLKSKYGDWVLDVLEYDTPSSLIAVFENAVVAPALAVEDELIARKTRDIRTRHVRDYAELRKQV
jgi:hypothetical protein